MSSTLRQQQLVPELNNLLDTTSVDDFDASKRSCAKLNIDITRSADHMVQPLKSNLDEVVPGIVRDADERQPFRLYLIAEAKGSDLNLCLFGVQQL